MILKQIRKSCCWKEENPIVGRKKILLLEERKSYQVRKVQRGKHTTMEEQSKSEEINMEEINVEEINVEEIDVKGVTCLLAAQMEALIER